MAHIVETTLKRSFSVMKVFWLSALLVHMVSPVGAAEEDGLTETLQNYIRHYPCIVEICIFEQRWVNPTEDFPKGRLYQRAVVTGVHKGEVPIGTKLEYYHLIENPPKFFSNFSSVVEGELRTFFFDPDDGERKGDYLLLSGDGHWGFKRGDEHFWHRFQRELRENPELRSNAARQ